MTKDNNALPLPEHEKLAKISEKSQAIGEFLEWCHTRRIVLADYACIGSRSRLFPTQYSIVELLAEFFEIDLNVIEEEKRAILAALNKPKE